MRVDVPTLLYVIYIIMFIGLFIASGFMFGFQPVTFVFMGFIGLVIVMIDFTSRVIREPDAK